MAQPVTLCSTRVTPEYDQRLHLQEWRVDFAPCNHSAAQEQAKAQLQQLKEQYGQLTPVARQDGTDGPNSLTLWLARTSDVQKLQGPH